MINKFRLLPMRKIVSLMVIVPIFILGILIIGGAALMATNQSDPYTSELAFVEYSENSEVEGSVVPASCHSNPKSSHFVGDCTCSITWSACTPASLPGCSRTISWNTNLNPVYTARLWRGAVQVAVGSSGSIGPVAIPAPSQLYIVKRPDGVPICSRAVPGPPAPTVNLTAVPNPQDAFQSITLTWDVDGASNCIPSGGAADWTGYADPDWNVLDSRAVIPPNDTTYGLTCTGPGGGPVTGSVVVDVNPPDVTFGAAPAHIGPVGSVPDTSVLSWTIDGATNCTASAVPFDATWNGPLAFVNGTPDSQSVTPLSTTNYTLTCTGPGSPPATSRTVQVRMPSGTLSASSCTVADFASSCISNVNWSSVNFLGVPEVIQNDSTIPLISNAPNGSDTRGVSPSDFTFTLDDLGSTFEIVRNPTVTCNVNSVWAGNVCWPRPEINIVTEDAIRRSYTTDVVVEVNADYPTVCTMDDGGLAPHVFNHAAAAGFVSHVVTTRQLTATQIITVSCEHAAYPTVNDSEQARIEVIPTFEEV